MLLTDKHYSLFCRGVDDGGKKLIKLAPEILKLFSFENISSKSEVINIYNNQIILN
jgi:hypothetical protein